MRLEKFIAAAVMGAIGSFASPVVHASITGYGWRTPQEIASFSYGSTSLMESLLSTFCHGPTFDAANGHCRPDQADVVFTTQANSLHFDNTQSATGTIQDWLGSSLSPINVLINSIPGELMDSTIWLFEGFLTATGTLANPQTFTIDHDDGVTLLVNGEMVINHPGPSVGPPNPLFVSSGTYTGGSGVVPFQLVYAECCGSPARLNVNLPEPGNALLVGTALFGLCASARGKATRRRPAALD